MKHVDFSFCQISKEDVRVIGDGLKDNHTVLGLHIRDGNCAKVDKMGFVHEDDNTKRDIIVENYSFVRM